MPDVSIVIPCYNSAHYLVEAVESVHQYKGHHTCEIIIVDDGSTDEQTLSILNDLKARGCIVAHQSNKGPAAARNAGVKLAKSNYIVFLDSDNKIRAELIDICIAELRQKPAIGVVYGLAHFFNDDNHTTPPRFPSGPLVLNDLLQCNYIDMCAMVRLEAYREVGGLDEERILIGHEDWDFWISLAAKGWEFRFIDKILFDYRVRENSLITLASSREKFAKMKQYIFSKHSALYYPFFEELLKKNSELSEEASYYRQDKQSPIRSMVKFAFNKYFKPKE